MVLNYTWDDVEAELVLRNLEQPAEERQRLMDYFVKLREECGSVGRAAKSVFQFGHE
jgi:hypothetical protein